MPIHFSCNAEDLFRIAQDLMVEEKKLHLHWYSLIPDGRIYRPLGITVREILPDGCSYKYKVYVRDCGGFAEFGQGEKVFMGDDEKVFIGNLEEIDEQIFCEIIVQHRLNVGGIRIMNLREFWHYEQQFFVLDPKRLEAFVKKYELSRAFLEWLMKNVLTAREEMVGPKCYFGEGIFNENIVIIQRALGELVPEPPSEKFKL